MLLDELREIVGEAACTTDAAELEPHLTEWRGAVVGQALAMVSPASTEQVAAVVRSCARHSAGVVPQGGNTGLCGGAIPDTSGTQVLLSLSRMNRIREVDAEGFSITVEAGCILADVQAAAAGAGRCFPLSLAAEGSCQIGGNLSTNAGGINVVRYGTARQQVLGLEVVLADGSVWEGLRSLRKDTAGYDLKQLFIGSEGTLGIITAATLRLYPDPGETSTALLAIASAEAALPLLGILQQAMPGRVSACELISARCLELVLAHIPGTREPFAGRSAWYLLVDAATGDRPQDFEAALAKCLEARLAGDVIIAKNAAEADGLWHVRHSISEAQRPEGACLKHDLSLPLARLGRFLREAESLIADREPDARPVVFGHVGDGNLHYNVLQPEGANGEEFRGRGRRLTAELYDLVAGLGGSFSAEHGIGVTKKAALERYRGGIETGMMRAVKKALDPDNLLNPGKVI